MFSSKESTAPLRAYSSPARSAATGRACHARGALALTSVTVNSNGSVTLDPSTSKFDAADACI
eukprot:3401163-Lingulodinium_polyedra.AAC.1